MELTKSFASDSGHWYSFDGTPAYTIIGKNGKERNTTLRDARDLKLAPSVTKILNAIAKPGLEKWKQANLLMASLTLPRIEGESLDDYAERCIADSKEQSKKAMDLGTSIHTSLELAYLGKSFDPAHSEIVMKVQEEIKKKWGNELWTAEKSFACKLGYGGKVDLSGDEIVIDFKTTSKPCDTAKDLVYEEHIMQLAAYSMGLFGNHDAIQANVFISTTTGNVQIVEHSWHDSYKAWQMFEHILEFWKLKNGYDPQMLSVQEAKAA